MGKVKKEINKRSGADDWKERLMRLADQTGNYIMKIYFLMLMIICPFYMQNGYREIGAVKYFLFRKISLVIMGIMVPVAIITFLCHRKTDKKISVAEYCRRRSVTDMFAYGYLVVVLISYLLTNSRREAFLGAEGWYMGLVSQFIFVGIYFMFSRYFRWDDDMLYVILCSSGLVFLLGILNRYSIYPIPIEVKSPGFISTLGNINWFCGYWSVLAPIGIMFYWNSREGWQRAVAGTYMVICFICGVTQGSQSAYLALAGIFVLLFCLSFQENRKAYRFLEICIMFALSCQMARLLRYMPGFTMNYEDDFGAVFTNTNLTLYIEVALLALYLLFYYMTKHRDYQISGHKALRRVILILITAIFSIYLILAIVNTCVPGGIAGFAGRQIFTFNDKWGNSRGIIWISGLLVFREMTIVQKLVGVGPDCFTECVYKVPELAERIYMAFGDSRLTNAHNEWITMLVNQGILGLICYVGIFVSALIRFIRKAPTQPILYLCAASVLAYMIHNVVSFQQILNTPFVFLIIGIGEGIQRDLCPENDNRSRLRKEHGY